MILKKYNMDLIFNIEVLKQNKKNHLQMYFFSNWLEDSKAYGAFEK